MGTGPGGRLRAHGVGVPHKDVRRSLGRQERLGPAVDRDHVVGLIGQRAHEIGRARLGRAVDDEDLKRLGGADVGRPRGRGGGLVVAQQREAQLSVAVDVDVAVGAHVLLPAAVVVVHQANHAETRLVRGLDAEGRVLEDPHTGALLGVVGIEPEPAARLEVDVGELLVAPADVLGRDRVAEKAGKPVRLERDRELAHGRRARHDHGDARGRELLEELARAGKHLDLVRVAVTHMGADRLVDVVGRVAEAELLVVDPAHLLEREGLDALEEPVRHRGAVMREHPLGRRGPHSHRVDDSAVDIEDRPQDVHRFSPPPRAEAWPRVS